MSIGTSSSDQFTIGPSTLPVSPPSPPNNLPPTPVYNPPPTTRFYQPRKYNYSNTKGYNLGPIECFSKISQIALLIVGAMGAAGYFNPLVLGCSTAALGASSSICLIYRNYNRIGRDGRRVATGLLLIQTAALISSVCLGIIGACGLLTLNQLSWIAISFYLLTTAVDVSTCINASLKELRQF